MKSIFRSIMRLIIKRPYYFIRRNLKQVIISYLIGVLPLGYSFTSFTTNTPITNFNSVISVMQNSGLVNILSAGTITPIYNGLKSGTGTIISSLGNFVNNESLVESGTNLVKEADSWFNQGETLTNKVKNGVTILNNITISDASNSDTTTSDNSSSSEWSFDNYPDYYNIIGISNIDPSTFPEKGSIIYSDLDHLGRTQEVKGTLTPQNVINSAKEKPLRYDGSNLDVDFRGKNDNPSGWPKNKKVSIAWLYGKSYHGYMWNRSHLIADSLGGDAIAQNAITGTRTQNVGGQDQKGGMRYIEIKVTDYLKNNPDGIVYYSALPIYTADELIPRKVIVRAKSEDGQIDEEVETFNYANGWVIDYNTGNITVK